LTYRQSSAGRCSATLERSDLCTRMLLASPSGLQSRVPPEVEAAFLGRKVSAEPRARCQAVRAASRSRVARSRDVGVCVAKRIDESGGDQSGSRLDTFRVIVRRNPPKGSSGVRRIGYESADSAGPEVRV